MPELDIAVFLLSKHPAVLIYTTVLCVFLYLSLWVMTGGVLVSLSQGISLANHKILFHKFAEQQARAIFYAHICLTVLVGVIWAVCLIFAEDTVMGNLNPMAWGALGANFIILGLNALNTKNWQNLKKSSGLHLVLSVVLAVLLFICPGLVAALSVKMATEAFISLQPLNTVGILPCTTEQLYMAFTALGTLLYTPANLVIMCMSFLAAGFAVSAAKGSAWLIWRRNKDDFGRDYYNFAIHYSALIGVMAAITSLIFCRVLFFITHYENSFAVYADGSFLILGAFASVILAFSWYYVSRAKTPLRHKASIAFNCFLTFVLLNLWVLFWAQFIIRLGWGSLQGQDPAP